jgi:peroxiredoxin family protein
MWEYYFGRSLNSASSEEIQAIKETEAYQNMGVYPCETSIQVIDNYVVIKMSED